VNAFQREADVAVQKSLREGFGLTVSEAIWKGTPVVGGDEGGILVESVEECAEAIVRLLDDAPLAEAKAHAGRERVRREFLTPRLVRDELALYVRLLAGR
jgi:trehalose synthase